jgi:hypothetical protein
MMWRAVAAAFVLIMVAGVGTDAAGEAPGRTTILRNGGAAGGDALVIPRGDILNVRNIQGGTASDPNLDLGAGSSTHRGVLALNYDVGRCVVIYDGHRRRLAKFCPHKIVFYVKPQVR